MGRQPVVGMIESMFEICHANALSRLSSKLVASGPLSQPFCWAAGCTRGDCKRRAFANLIALIAHSEQYVNIDIQ
jgi:hypothetical protein